MAKRRKAVKAAGTYGPGKGLLMLLGVVLIVLGIVLYIKRDDPEMLSIIIAIVLVIYGLKKVLIGYKC